MVAPSLSIAIIIQHIIIVINDRARSYLHRQRTRLPPALTTAMSSHPSPETLIRRLSASEVLFNALHDVSHLVVTFSLQLSAPRHAHPSKEDIERAMALTSGMSSSWLYCLHP